MPINESYSIEQIESRIEKNINLYESGIVTLLDSFDRGKKDWPYIFPGIARKDNTTYSISTNSMIIFTLLSISGKILKSYLIPNDVLSPYISNKYLDDIDEVIEQAAKNLCEIVANNKDIVSKTFGTDDPLSFYWCYKIGRYTQTTDNKSVANKLVENIIGKINYEYIENRLETGELFQFSNEDQKDRRSIINSFPILRYAQLFLEICEEGKNRKSEDKDPINTFNIFSKHFRSCIDNQLAAYLTSEIEFDAAELVFALEGLIILEKQRVKLSKIEKVLQILEERQAVYPFWRPTKPIIAKSTGEVLMPVSVEVANSLLRICTRLVEIYGEEILFRHLGLFIRYEEWLKSILVFVTHQKKNYYGWRSEHISENKFILLWETSQVVLFLSFYISLLKKFVARKSIEKMNLHLITKEEFKKLKTGDLNLNKKDKTGKSWENDWEKIKEKYEPIKEDNSLLVRIYDEIQKYYLEPRLNKDKKINENMHYSMILYGPPGTGKTSLAKCIANILEYDFIVITPSDFIAGGTAKVEAKAKAIFEALNKQERVVILFDEIDRLILDRDASAYGQQSDIFQFMTPSMLVKFKELRERESSIFIIATNYFERIDNAIKRKGRVDDTFLVLPPDYKFRYEYLKEHLTNKDIDKPLIQEIAKRTALYTIDELNQLVDKLSQLVINSKINIENINIHKPLISFKSYEERIKGEWPQKALYEFLCLCYLYCENKGHELGKNVEVLLGQYRSGAPANYSENELNDLIDKIFEELNTVK